ncbi:hypothetical protein P7K49_000491, partial [Saguinus oedipus]
SLATYKDDGLQSSSQLKNQSEKEQTGSCLGAQRDRTTYTWNVFIANQVISRMWYSAQGRGNALTVVLSARSNKTEAVNGNASDEDSVNLAPIRNSLSGAILSQWLNIFAFKAWVTSMLDDPLQDEVHNNLSQGS